MEASFCPIGPGNPVNRQSVPALDKAPFRHWGGHRGDSQKLWATWNQALDLSVWLSALKSFRFFICAVEIKIEPIPLI